MSIRKIDTAISTIRSLYDENGNYLPSGNYYFSIKDYEKGVFTGDMASSGEFGEFTFSPKKLIKMMAVSQSRLARRAGLQREEGMPSYPSPLARNCGSRLSHFTTTSSYVVRNYSSENVVLREEPSTCSICFEKINRCDKKSLNCNHDFHRNCINTWLREQNNCPLCRASQSTTEESTTRLDPLREAINELRTVTSNRNRLYNQLTNRDYTTRRNNRTVVFPSSRRK
jgi:hypothetical protein